MRLLFDLPVEAKWASGLEFGFAKFNRLNIPTTEAPHGILQAPLKKYTEWREKAQRDFLDAVFKRWTLDEAPADNEDNEGPLRHLRMSIAALVPNNDEELRRWVECYPDKWVQIGAARTKRFRTPEEVQEWFDRHGWDFLESVGQN